jgi:hypothetical protein
MVFGDRVAVVCNLGVELTDVRVEPVAFLAQIFDRPHMAP